VCISCAQLSDNVTLSTALALQRFLDSCRTAILQANDRSDDAANDTVARGVYARENKVPDDREKKLTCGLCLPNTPNANKMCCNNGDCVNGTCRCKEG